MEESSNTQEDKVDFDVLLRSPGSGKEPTLATIEQFRPPPEEIENCRRFLATQGIEAHTTTFGLACKAEKKLFEKLFNVTLKPLEPKPGEPQFEILGQLDPPKEIADLIEDITITPFPEFF